MHPRRPISMGQAKYSVRDEQSHSTQLISSSSPLMLHFPTPLFPRTPSQVVRSVPTLALKPPRRNSCPCRGTDLISLSR